MKEYLEVDGYPKLVRDPESNAILNVDFEKIAAAQKRKPKSTNATRKTTNRKPTVSDWRRSLWYQGGFKITAWKKNL